MRRGYQLSETRIVGIHRNAALAAKHLAQLGEGWEIRSRLNSKGEESANGHTFIFAQVEEPDEDVYEWLVSFTYSDSGRTFDVIVTATDEESALETAKQFLADDPNGKNIARSNFLGWETVIARGEKVTNLEAGEAEYRGDSEDDNSET